jgi:hypothetical protein
MFVFLYNAAVGFCEVDVLSVIEQNLAAPDTLEVAHRLLDVLLCGVDHLGRLVESCDELVCCS